MDIEQFKNFIKNDITPADILDSIKGCRSEQIELKILASNKFAKIRELAMNRDKELSKLFEDTNTPKRVIKLFEDACQLFEKLKGDVNALPH